MKIPKQEESSGGIDFLPSVATHNAVCIGGWILGEFPPFKEGGKNKVAFRAMFEVDELIEAPNDPEYHGKRKTVTKEWNIRTWNKDSNFYKDIVGWLGRELTDVELENFSGKTLRGIPALIGIRHDKQNEGKTFANITTISGIPKSMIPMKPLRNMVAPEWIVKYIERSISDPQTKMELLHVATDPMGTGSPQSVSSHRPADAVECDEFGNPLPF